eukprot:g16254.t1
MGNAPEQTTGFFSGFGSGRGSEFLMNDEGIPAQEEVGETRGPGGAMFLGKENLQEKPDVLGQEEPPAAPPSDEVESAATAPPQNGADETETAAPAISLTPGTTFLSRPVSSITANEDLGTRSSFAAMEQSGKTKTTETEPKVRTKLNVRIAPWNGYSAAYSLSFDDGSDPMITFVPTVLQHAFIKIIFNRDR